MFWFAYHCKCVCVSELVLSLSTMITCTASPPPQPRTLHYLHCSCACSLISAYAKVLFSALFALFVCVRVRAITIKNANGKQQQLCSIPVQPVHGSANNNKNIEVAAKNKKKNNKNKKQKRIKNGQFKSQK